MSAIDTSSAASGRPALAMTRDLDFERVVKGVNGLPKMAAEQGIDVTVAWATTELRSLIDLLYLADPRTPEDAKAAHRVHIALSEGFVRVMARSDRAGFLMRRDFLTAIAHQLNLTLRIVFARTTADTRLPYIPQVAER